MLPKEQRELIKLIGRYKFNKLKDLGIPLSVESYKQYEEEQKKQQRLKKRLGYSRYYRMQGLGLSYKDFLEYEQKEKIQNSVNKKDRKREKDKIRFKTIRYLERYCDLEKKCQICETTQNVEIHHPNYKDYLKVNLLCKKHHTALHNFELIPPKIIDLEEIATVKLQLKEKQDYINENMNEMKKDVIKNGFTYRDLQKKYEISDSTIRNYFMQDQDYEILSNALKKNKKIKLIFKNKDNPLNPLLKYKLQNNLSTAELAKIVDIPVPTLRAIESGKTNLNKVSFKTKRKLKKIIA